MHLKVYLFCTSQKLKFLLIIKIFKFAKNAKLHEMAVTINASKKVMKSHYIFWKISTINKNWNNYIIIIQRGMLRYYKKQQWNYAWISIPYFCLAALSVETAIIVHLLQLLQKDVVDGVTMFISTSNVLAGWSQPSSFMFQQFDPPFLLLFFHLSLPL